MSPLVDALFLAVLLVLFVALVASVVAGRRMTDREAVGHDPRTCKGCAELRHPSNRHTRAFLAAMPRQTRKGER